MAKQAYKTWQKHTTKAKGKFETLEYEKFKEPELEKIEYINRIIEDYQKAGYTLSVRQLYYQLVSRDYVKNTKAEYDGISDFLSKARYGGFVDWDAIEDRGRVPHIALSFNSVSDRLQSAWCSFEIDRQMYQENYVEVWCEKDALTGILERVTEYYHVPLLVNKGFGSTTSIYQGAQRFRAAVNAGRKCTLLYLGDHDPSGLKMVHTDIPKRLTSLEVSAEKIEIKPIALTLSQIEQYQPPANPAKETDPNFRDYNEAYGGFSWEVDALKPEVLDELLRSEIESSINMSVFNQVLTHEVKMKDELLSLYFSQKEKEESIPDKWFPQQSGASAI